MKEKLEGLFVSAVIEESNPNIDYAIFGFKKFLSIIKETTDIYDEIPLSIHVSCEALSKTEGKDAITGLQKDLNSNFGKSVDKSIEMFESKGVLLYDDIYASAFGEMSYIYRSKGLRVYFLENHKFLIVTPYCYIDHNGFSLQQGVVDILDIKSHNLEETISDLQKYMTKTSEPFNKQLIRMLISIKKNFKKKFYLEYLFSPPDTNYISDFSEQIKEYIWQIALSDSFKNSWSEQVQENGMSYLLQLGIQPTNELIIDYIKNGGSNQEELLSRINNIELLLERKGSIIDLKPNIWGIGINVNEIFSRFKEKFGS